MNHAVGRLDHDRWVPHIGRLFDPDPVWMVDHPNLERPFVFDVQLEEIVEWSEVDLADDAAFGFRFGDLEMQAPERDSTGHTKSSSHVSVSDVVS